MSSSVGMMKFPTKWKKIIQMFQSSNQYSLRFFVHIFSWVNPLCLWPFSIANCEFNLSFKNCQNQIIEIIDRYSSPKNMPHLTTYVFSLPTGESQRLTIPAFFLDFSPQRPDLSSPSPEGPHRISM